MRPKLLGILCIFVSLFLVSTAYSTIFDFNDGTNQGWTYDVIAKSDGSILAGPLPTGWYDTNNYPNPPFTDPIDDNGSASVIFITTPYWPSDIEWAIIRFTSPDLSNHAQWQSADGFVCQLLDASSVSSTYTNLYVVVEDQNGTNRKFYNGTAVANSHNKWVEHTFSDLKDAIANASPPITDYTVKKIMVYVWIEWPTFSGLEGGFYLDYVGPVIEAWEISYGTLFDRSSDLALLRRYRDEFLTKSWIGSLYKNSLYKNSSQALKVLLYNPKLLFKAHDLIAANKDAIFKVLNGKEGNIYNTDEIISFLKSYAKHSPPALRLLANIFRWHMLINLKLSKPFLGFRLE